ncbi:MAG: MarR family transcriptional regulator [Dehalococcoidales bacterium]|nr:MarR family transcriptional regulator [Dehalococcoidales bacterium]
MEKAELINQIIDLQRQTNKVMGHFAAEPWIELGLTIAQLKSLFFIVDKEKTSFKKLAEALRVTPPNVTGIVDRLVEQGLVSRTENPEDRRIMLLQATQKGQDLLSTLKTNNKIQMSTILDQLNKEELSSLALGLNALSKAVRRSFPCENTQN